MINNVWVEQMAEIVLRITIKTKEKPAACKKNNNDIIIKKQEAIFG